MLTVILSSVVVAVAAVTQAVTGFGFALVVVPLLALLYDPRLVVMVSLSLGLLSKLPLLLTCWRQVEPLRIAPLCAAAIVGAVGGTRLLLRVDADALRLGLGLVVVGLAALLWLDRRWPIRRERVAVLVAGLLSGTLNGATSMGGPPVVLLGVNQEWAKESFRANLLAFFLVSNTSTLAMLSLESALTPGLLALDALLAPSLLIGLLLGGILFRAIPAERFRRLVILLVIATGGISVWTGGVALVAR